MATRARPVCRGALPQVQALHWSWGFTPWALWALSAETQLILLLFVKKVTQCVKMQIVNPQDKVDDFKH